VRTLIVLAVLAVLGVAGGAAFVASGIYNVAATEQHLAPVYWLLEATMRRSVQHHALPLGAPRLDDPAMVARGLGLYHGDCAPCHGAPGIAPAPFALGMNPQPANLAYTARAWRAEELFWVIRHGIKTTGMPAWHYRMSDDEMWAVVAFLKVLPNLTVADYRAQVERTAAVAPARAGDVPRRDDRDARARGARAMQQYACITCHVIPGITGATAPVGPPLAGMAQRGFIGGVLPNTRENMIRWLRSPPSVDPRTLMPDLGVTEQDAADIAAYLLAPD